jgi:hypothetical protein
VKPPVPVAQEALPGITRYADECMEKIRAMMNKPKPEQEKTVEREPGSDFEEDSAF